MVAQCMGCLKLNLLTQMPAPWWQTKALDIMGQKTNIYILRSMMGFEPMTTVFVASALPAEPLIRLLHGAAVVQ